MAFVRCGLEVRVGTEWRLAATVSVNDDRLGHVGGARLEYDFDYLIQAGDDDAIGSCDLHAVSSRYPITYEATSDRRWPAFLLDLIPAGAARRFWERELSLPNTESSDWTMLVKGAGYPPGNVRVREAVIAPTGKGHPGFERRDIEERGADFLEYARAHGAPISGGSGAGGDSPKFVLRVDRRGRWHAEGALTDASTKQAWLVKFPRNEDPKNRLVLRAEAAYHDVVRRLGARTFGSVTWANDALFVPRFDRIVAAKQVHYLGLESLYSLAGVSDFAASTPKEELAKGLAAVVTDPATELRELLLRDILDVALGNTDNHGRNTAVLKHPDGTIALSPIYDFAPMFLDPAGIARVCRWHAEDAGFPRWGEVADALEPLGLPASPTRKWLRSFAKTVRELPRTMKTSKVPASVIEACDVRIARVAKALAEVEVR